MKLAVPGQNGLGGRDSFKIVRASTYGISTRDLESNAEALKIVCLSQWWVWGPYPHALTPGLRMIGNFLTWAP